MKNEFANFDATMKRLIKVPHEKIKAKLDAEKAAKKFPKVKKKESK